MTDANSCDLSGRGSLHLVIATVEVLLSIQRVPGWRDTADGFMSGAQTAHGGEARRVIRCTICGHTALRLPDKVRRHIWRAHADIVGHDGTVWHRRRIYMWWVGVQRRIRRAAITFRAYEAVQERVEGRCQDHIGRDSERMKIQNCFLVSVLYYSSQS
jgi:hypothetical protein